MSELQKKVLKAGDGQNYPQKGQTVTVHYVGTFENGQQFDSSRNRGTPFKFKLGVGQVIKGWDEGVAKMSKGEKSLLTIPPHLAYGQRGQGSIPANTTLNFEVELIDFQ